MRIAIQVEVTCRFHGDFQVEKETHFLIVPAKLAGACDHEDSKEFTCAIESAKEEAIAKEKEGGRKSDWTYSATVVRWTILP